MFWQTYHSTVLLRNNLTSHPACDPCVDAGRAASNPRLIVIQSASGTCLPLIPVIRCRQLPLMAAAAKTSRILIDAYLASKGQDYFITTRTHHA